MPTSGTPHPHKTHVVQEGETLDRLAAKYYSDSTKWRIIAAANGIDDPLRVETGTELVIPAREPSRFWTRATQMWRRYTSSR